mgnify:FL=1
MKICFTIFICTILYMVLVKLVCNLLYLNDEKKN